MLVGAAAVAGAVGEYATRRHPLARAAVTAAATWTVLGGRSLAREAERLADHLAADDLTAARAQVRSLVGREASGLGSGELSRACVESVAENTSDAVVAPLLWGAIAGVPGLLAYRAVNTLDAMVGHHSPRYESFGWAAARLDDLANWLPARLTVALTLVAASQVGGSATAAARAVLRDARQHPSPNAGVVEAAFAGALGVQLGGRNRYGSVVEDRGRLGRGRRPGPADIGRATRLAGLVGSAALAVAVGIRLARR